MKNNTDSLFIVWKISEYIRHKPSFWLKGSLIIFRFCAISSSVEYADTHSAVKVVQVSIFRSHYIQSYIGFWMILNQQKVHTYQTRNFCKVVCSWLHYTYTRKLQCIQSAALISYNTSWWEFLILVYDTEGFIIWYWIRITNLPCPYLTNVIHG